MTVNGMIPRFLLAPLRCLAYLVLSVAGFLAFLLWIFACVTIVAYRPATRLLRALAALHRRLAARWAGVTIDAPVREEPEPERRPDGWYVHGTQLFKHRWFPAYLLAMERLGEDKALLREAYWLYAGLVVAVLPLVPVGLIVAGALTLPFGAGLIAAGVLAGPPFVGLYTRCARAMLRPPVRERWTRRGVFGWINARNSAAWRGAGLAGLSLAGLGGFLGTVLAAAVSWTMLTVPTLGLARPGVEFYRRIVREWTGVEIAEPYLPYPQPPRRDPDGRYRVGRSLYPDREKAIRGQRYGWLRSDRATWRDLAWMGTSWLAGLPLLIPAALIGVGFFGQVWQVIWWPLWAIPAHGATGEWTSPWYTWEALQAVLPALKPVPGWASVPIGLFLALIGILLARPLLRVKLRYDRLLLAPTRSAELTRRVAALTESRADAVDEQAAELRRIERDLHDGAQARLIAVGLSLATVDSLMESDPVSARAMLAQARETSSAALTELRQLVRGIHPPVLSERGLVDAVRAIALDCPVPVDVTADLPGRPPAPVESAAYFAVCEALANASRHAGADRVHVDIGYDGSRLRLVVTDDGHGGADPSRGTGLAGIRRRLGTFDGTLEVHSPVGGPTEVKVEIPCALSSPKISTF
jgi:signal transduction histidine kinase